MAMDGMQLAKCYSDEGLNGIGKSYNFSQLCSEPTATWKTT